MLIEFTVGNYLSFKDKATFSMVKSESDNNLSEICSFEPKPDSKFRLLKTAAVYGANSSGKSNLVKSFDFMRTFVIYSVSSPSYFLGERNIATTPFFLSASTLEKPSFFEIIFIENNIRYRYGFEANADVVKSEWLYRSKENRETMLFEREGQSIEYNKRSFKEATDFISPENIVKKTRSESLFLSVLKQFDGTISSVVINWFENFYVISGIMDLHYRNFTINLFDVNSDFRNWSLKILSQFDISNVKLKEKESLISKNRLNEKNDRVSESLSKYLEKPKFTIKKQVFFSHIFLGSDSKPAGEIEFPMQFESAGTQKLFYFLGPLYEAIHSGRTIIVDELDSRFHPLLTTLIIEFFSNKNNSKAQLIFTSHDTSLLKKEIFRRDQIWFTEKDKYNSTQLYSLDEYKEYYARKDASFAKDYLNGKYGAVPVFGNKDELLEIIYGK
ncbi:MAG: ATP-binding protein [Candidatus Delongbacteria bacterium]|nr:ATP-binding protein [Candidatus Delongbacteria bacterium]MCG2759669.1 ATP-binding protein [Candidatus Delongbacteria bacterium]